MDVPLFSRSRCTGFRPACALLSPPGVPRQLKGILKWRLERGWLGSRFTIFRIHKILEKFRAADGGIDIAFAVEPREQWIVVHPVVLAGALYPRLLRLCVRRRADYLIVRIEPCSWQYRPIWRLPGWGVGLALSWLR